MRPSCGMPLLGDVHAAEHLHAADERRVQFLRNRVARESARRRCDSRIRSGLILGLDVQVGRALGDRVVDDAAPADARPANPSVATCMSRRARARPRLPAPANRDVAAIGVAPLEQIPHVLRRRARGDDRPARRGAPARRAPATSNGLACSTSSDAPLTASGASMCLRANGSGTSATAAGSAFMPSTDDERHARLRAPARAPAFPR